MTSYWNTPERLALLERTCGLPECWHALEIGQPIRNDAGRFLFDDAYDALIRDHATEWLGIAHGIGIFRTDRGEWYFMRKGFVSGPFATRDEAIEAALRWVLEHKP